MIFLNLDMSPILEMQKEMTQSVNKAMADATRDLAIMSHAHILEQVQEKLHSTRQKYVDALSIKQVDADTWVIHLDKSALFIEEGLAPNTDMLDGLLKSPKAKMGKDGSKYIAVPFEHNKGQTSQTPAQTDLTNTIKAEMKKRKIPYGKLEMGADGKPKLGNLHSFDIMKAPLRTGQGAGQGHGPVGSVKQGPTGIPFLQGVRVSQHEVKGKDGSTSVKKSITTFRIASSKHKGQGRWLHPGLEAKKFLDEAYDWAQAEWEKRIKDQVLMSITKNF